MSLSNTINESFRLVAQLQVTDLSKAAWTLTDRFGFKSESGYEDVRNIPEDTRTLRMRRLNQVIELSKTDQAISQGNSTFDHLSLKTNNVDAAVMAFRAKWAKLDPMNTPDGAVDLPTFWSQGVRIAFILGPEDARFELCENLAPKEDPCSLQFVNLGGHDHFGVRCRDVEEAAQFYAQFGFETAHETEIQTPDGAIEIRFVRCGNYLLEIASTPETRAKSHAFSTHPAWSKIIIETNDPGAKSQEYKGPNGERVEVRASIPSAAFKFDRELA
ncbi:VOC family protein [Polycladidibacter stylochi]|uniref:VOC family protein n=1 Tax=Polycladidibacter stylochi TaxID=1807766 RepID=UPI00082A376A|nr:VOC family protein [Pseudovibrio stylochi]